MVRAILIYPQGQCPPRLLWWPPTSEDDHGPEGHDDHGDEEVGHCQGHQEVVGHVLQLSAHVQGVRGVLYGSREPL